MCADQQKFLHLQIVGGKDDLQQKLMVGMFRR